MSTVPDAPDSRRYPFTFQITDGPSFQRIADAAKYYHDPKVTMVMEFSGILTEKLTGKTTNVKLTANVYGFVSGRDYARGEMTVFLTIHGYFTRYGSQMNYNWRERRSTRPIELDRVS